MCCCIEIDYDKLDKLIQDKTHLLNIYGTKAEHFVNLWNYQVNKINVWRNLKDNSAIFLRAFDRIFTNIQKRKKCT